MSYYQREEQETLYNYDPIDGNWRIYSTYPPHIRKLLSYATITDKSTDGDGRVIEVKGYVEPINVKIRMYIFDCLRVYNFVHI